MNRRPETISPSLSSRQNPIRLAPLATFPTRGRLCPLLFFFSTYACIRFDDARKAVDRVLSQTAYLRRFLFHLYHLLETIFFALFHTASTLSGSLRSPPSPRGEGFVSGLPLPPSNLRPFGAPPSIGRRDCPREPLPLEGAAERSEAGLASFWGGEAASSLPSPLL